MYKTSKNTHTRQSSFGNIWYNSQFFLLKIIDTLFKCISLIVNTARKRFARQKKNRSDVKQALEKATTLKVAVQNEG